METELKQAIVGYIFAHKDEFQLHNATVNEFRAYIYNEQGEYLIGGEKVAEFIDQALKVLVWKDKLKQGYELCTLRIRS